MTNSYLDHTYSLILAGGGGTRLWPKSRVQTPKQFLKLAGNQTMLQITATRFSKLVNWNKIIVVTTKQYIDTVRDQLPDIPEENIIAEPEKRDTAMAMLVGALFAKSKDPDAILVNDAADHVVVDEQEFLRIMKVAAQVAAKKENLVTVGILPTSPSNAFGYIKVGEEIANINHTPIFRVESFTEKPKVATAKAFISTGRYFWNANNYVWSADALQAAFKEHMPETYELTKSLDSLSPEKFANSLPEIYKKAQSISIDYAISEKANNLVLIPGDFGWDDIGEWKTVYVLGQKDLAGNVIVSDDSKDSIHTLAIESQNNLIHSNGRLIAMIGVNDMIVVDTDEIVMIAPKSRSQDVKKLVERLKEEKRLEYL